MASETKVGTFTGTGAAINVSLGFTPDYIRIWNITDGTESFEFFAGMTAGHALYQRNVVDNGVTGNGSQSRITANGVSPFAGNISTPKGFAVGTAISTAGKQYRYVAVRDGTDF